MRVTMLFIMIIVCMRMPVLMIRTNADRGKLNVSSSSSYLHIRILRPSPCSPFLGWVVELQLPVMEQVAQLARSLSEK